VADIINQMNVIDPQVLMHVKFVEINANDVQELGFEYTFSRVSTDSSVSHPEGSVESLLYLMPPDYYSLAYVSDNTSVWKAEKSFGIFTESVGTTDDNAGGFAKIHDKVTASNVQTINSGTYFSFPNDMDNTAYYYVDLPDKSRAVTFGSNSNLVRNAKDDPTAFNAD